MFIKRNTSYLPTAFRTLWKVMFSFFTPSCSPTPKPSLPLTPCPIPTRLLDRRRNATSQSVRLLRSRRRTVFFQQYIHFSNTWSFILRIYFTSLFLFYFKMRIRYLDLLCTGQQQTCRLRLENLSRKTKHLHLLKKKAKSTEMNIWSMTSYSTLRST